MDEVLEFLDKRVKFLGSFEEDKEDTIDGEEIYLRGMEQGKYEEVLFVRKKIKEILDKKINILEIQGG